MKRILFMIFASCLLVLSACGNDDTDNASEDDKSDEEVEEQQEKQDEQQEQPEESESEEDSEEAKETSDSLEESDPSQVNKDEIEEAVNSVVDSDLNNTTITKLTINEDASVDKERYIVLVNLKWDVKNRPKTTKEMLDMYSDHLAAKLADNKLIYELVLFWEVPYHKEDDTILKRTYQNKDDGMYLEDEMKDISIFE